MPKGAKRETNLQMLLQHIHSLGIVSRDQIGGGEADDLLRMGLIRKVWIGSYALTEAGRKRLRERRD